MYFHFGNFRKKHFTFGIVNGKLQITSTNHEDFITAIQKKINKLAKNKNQKNFIKLALKETLTGCNFIIFSPNGENNKFIQYWTESHQLKFNFYVNKENKLKKFYYPLLGLLAECGYVDSKIEQYRGSLFYKVDKNKDFISIDVNFRNDVDLATNFTYFLFRKIYKIKGKKLMARVE